MKNKNIVYLILVLCMITTVFAYSGDDWAYADGIVRITPLTDAYNKSVCLKDGTNCPSVGSGSVTNVGTTGPYLTGGPITTTGTISINSSAFCLANGTNCAAGGTGMTSWTISNGTTTAAVLNNTRVNLTSGLGISITQANLDFVFNVTLVGLTTSNLNEGTNLYYTDLRAVTAVINTSILRNNTVVNFTQILINSSQPITYNGSCFKFVTPSTNFTIGC